MASLNDSLSGLDPALKSVLLAIAEGVEAVAGVLRTASVQETGTSNLLGDKQLVADVAAHDRVMAALSSCPAVAAASSEEQPTDLILNNSPLAPSEGSRYSVAFDPLDGSSIIGAGWAVGSIFAVFPGSGFVGHTGHDMVAASYAVHGPRTTLVIARPKSRANLPSTSDSCLADVAVQEFLLGDQGWVMQRDNVRIADSKKVFAPANLRASADNAAYRELVQAWMAERYTLRYSGGMVPDVHHIFAKGGGVFCNPRSPTAPAKLRVLYECLPLAFCVEAAGGASLGMDGSGSALDAKLVGHDDRSTICLGSKAEVERCRSAMQGGASLSS